MKWKVSISWPGELPDSLRKTPCSTEDLRTKFGMDYFVSDLLEGPEFILRALCLEANINRLPVAIKSSKERQLVESGLFKKFGIGSTFYNVKSSAYGKQSKQTITTAVRKAMYLGNSVDSEAISNLQQQIRHIQASLQEADNIIKEFGTKHDQIKRLIDEKKHAKEDLQAQKRDIQLKAQRYKTKLHNLERMKKELEELRKKPELDKEKITELEVSMRHFAEKEDELFEKYGRALEKCVDLYEKRNLSILGYVHTEARYIAVTHYARQHTSGLEAAEAGMVSAKREHAIAERATKRYMEDCSRAGHDLPEHLDARYKEIVSRWKQEGLNTTLDQLEETIAEEEGRAEAIRFANPDAMRDYAGRKAEVTCQKKGL
jgi:chromosome segregation ATPase